MTKKKQDQPVKNQLDIDNKVYTECSRKEVRIAFENIWLNEKQITFLDFNLKDIFKYGKIFLEDYQLKNEIVKPKFDIIHYTDDYVFLTYSNKTKFDSSYGKMLKDNIPVEDVDSYSFEYIMFMLIDFKTLDIVYIKNKKATFWKESLQGLLEKNGFKDVRLLPYQDSEIIKLLKQHPIKHIEFSTASKELISKNISFSNLEAENFVDKCSISLKFKQKEKVQKSITDYVEKNFLNKKNQYSKILIGFEENIVDVFKSTVVKSSILNIPKTFEKDSVHMAEIENKLLTAYKELIR